MVSESNILRPLFTPYSSTRPCDTALPKKLSSVFFIWNSALLHKFVILTILSNSAGDVEVILKERSCPGAHFKVTWLPMMVKNVISEYDSVEYTSFEVFLILMIHLLSLSLILIGHFFSIDACTLMAAAWSWVVSFSLLMSCSFVASRSFSSSCWLLKLRVLRNTSFANHVLIDSTGGGVEKFGHRKRGW